MSFCSTIHPCIGDGRLVDFASGETGGEQRDSVIVNVVHARDRHRATLRRAAHTTDLGIMIRIEQAMGSERCEQVAILHLKPIKELGPGSAVIEPGSPLSIELIFDICGKIRQGDATGNRLKAFSASCPSDLKHQPRLGEVVSLWESAAHEKAAFWAEDTIGVPPAGAVHFSVTGDDQPEL